MSKTAITKIEVNDLNELDCYNLRISGSTYDLVELLLELDDDEQGYLLEALEQARALQKLTDDHIKTTLELLQDELLPEKEE